MYETKAITELKKEVINSAPVTKMVDTATGNVYDVPRTAYLKNRKFFMFIGFLLFGFQFILTAVLIDLGIVGSINYSAFDINGQFFYWHLIVDGWLLYSGIFLIVYGVRKRRIAELMRDKENSTGVPSLLLGMSLLIYGTVILVVSSIKTGLGEPPFDLWTASEDGLVGIIIILVVTFLSFVGGLFLAMGIRGKDLVGSKYT